jgi:hypothetical protein
LYSDSNKNMSRDRLAPGGVSCHAKATGRNEKEENN